MTVIPCNLCGYDAPATLCPHCGGASLDPSFAPIETKSQRLWAGLSALPRGLGYLATTPKTKRWLIPPFLLTTAAFTALFWWAWNGFERLVNYTQGLAATQPALDVAWWDRAIEAILRSSAFVIIAKLSGAFLFAVLGFFAAIYVFSLFYEAISGPFLDEVHGRIERRWFGLDPRNAIQRPTNLSVVHCGLVSLAAATVASGLCFWAWRAGGALRWWLMLPAVIVPFAALGLAHREYGRWLVWVLRVETVTLWTSVRTSLLALLLLVICLPLKFIPFVGPILFGAAAGFATAISLMDIPFSRRRWSMSQRLSFFTGNLLPLVAFGSVAGLVFLIPLFGPILMVPAASIGGLWLVVRLDKSKLRVRATIRAARIAAR
jgi:uncharacterized protein involved in cysteine biosynthesis